MPNSFLLTKWYLDCVAENGDTVILYTAALRWNALSLRYGSLLTAFDRKVSTTTSLHRISDPQLDGDRISVRQPGLEIAGTWESLGAPIRKTLYQTADGSVDWHCLQPKSQVDVSIGSISLRGLGYAECLTLSLLPWQLPLAELHWGRFLSPDDAILWIDWRGEHSQTHVIVNGDCLPAKSVTASEIVFDNPDRKLTLDRGLTLRSGRLGDTVFPMVARLAALLPRTMLSVNECKWRSRAVFRDGPQERSGWAIHEVVDWGK